MNLTPYQEITKDLITGALDVDVTIDNRIFAAALELASGAELTEEERADGKKLNWEILRDEQKDLPGNIIVSNTLLVTGAKDIITSAFDIDTSNPKKKNYLKVLSTKQRTRFNSLFKTKSILSAAEDAKYYNNPEDKNDGYHDPKTGEIFINLARAGNTPEEQTQFLINLSLHEGGHPDPDYNNLSRAKEESLVRSYQTQTSDLINFYHNIGDNKDSMLSNIVSWGFENSSAGGAYSENTDFLNNLYQDSTKNVTPTSISMYNSVSLMANPNEIETDVAFHLECSRAGGNGHMSGYFQDEEGYWFRSDQGMTKKAMESANSLAVLMNFGYEAGVRVNIIDVNKKQKLITDYLVNDPNTVFIRTSKEKRCQAFSINYKIFCILMVDGKSLTPFQDKMLKFPLGITRCNLWVIHLELEEL